ncbi:transporter substrate-binding domain-containing protein [Pelagibius sp.]|uniref:transporter substrate-binding domain-containing protein n=1 Tax=Pelagibius sp. TaxID=1931238 RepID=UPI00261B77EF|nr:transporter substrate-binding domain-containing protein [Pelagibius sp.]
MKYLFTKLTALLAAALLFAGLSGTASAQDAESTWERIKRTSEVRFAVFTYPPYFVKDPGSGEWGGALVEMARDVAKELKVDLEMVEVGGWSELVLAISTGKVDFAAGMQATPIRATAIDFAGPIYWIEWVTVNNPKFEGKNWEDYNDPDVKVAVMTGTSDQILLDRWAPKATQLQFKELSQIILAVSSGRADAFTTTVLSSMIAKEKNPGLGTFNTPKPRAALPGYFGIRSEFDPRFKNFLNWWAEWNNELGANERRMKEGMMKYSGITEIPDSVSFSK